MPHNPFNPFRRPIGLPMGTSNLKWKRDTATAPATVTLPSADVEMINTGPVRFSRSLSYVRVAPYATDGMQQKT